MFRDLQQLAQGNSLKAKLIRGGLGSGGVQVANRLLALALGIILARMLGPDGYGVYAYAFAIMSILMVVAEAGVPTLLMREMAASDGRSQWGELRGALRRGVQFVTLASTMVSLVGLVVLWWFADSLQLTVLYTIIMMLLVLPVAALCKVVAHAMRGLHYVVLGQTVDMLIRPLLVVGIVALVFTTFPEQRQPYIAMAAQLVGALLVLMIGMLVLPYLLPKPSRNAVPQYRNRQWLKSALPFLLIGGGGVINSQADVIMLGWFMTVEDVGVYRVAAQGALLITFGLQAVSAVIAPQFSRLYAQGDMANLQRMVTLSIQIILVVSLPFCFILVLEGEYFINFIFGEAYVNAYYALSILAFGQFIAAVIGIAGPLVSMANQEQIVAISIWVSTFLNVLLNLVMIPLFGVSGAAIATTITIIVWHGILFLIAASKLGIWCAPFYLNKR